MLIYVVVLLFISFAHALESDIYLSGNLIPVHYDLQYIFDINPESKFAYFGVVSILFTVQNQINKITMHADTFTIAENKVNLATDSGDVPAIIDIELSDMYDFLVVTLSTDLNAGQNYTLTIPFSGTLHRDPYGLFLTSYLEEDNKDEIYMVVSNFNPAGAHRAFPCFDEPQYKATFSIVIGHHVKMTAISNMPSINSTNINPLHQYWPMTIVAERFKTQKEVFAWDQFGKTPSMSTYLVAIVVTNMVSMMKSKINDSQLDIRVWSRRGKTKTQLNSGAHLVQRLANAHVDFLKIKYPLPKLEVFAMPTLSQPCYQHWGLLMCLEDIIIYNKEADTGDLKEQIFAEISQKVAQQWFGGLVSARTWQDQWINEGLSRVLVPLSMEQLDRDYKFQNNFVVQYLLRFLDSDSVASSLPLRIIIEEPRDILAAQNSILHEKAFLVMHMVYKLMTYDTFAAACQNYLRQNSFSLGDFDSFTSIFATFLQQSKLPALTGFREMIEPWVRQEGYPLLKVYRDGFSDNALRLSQQLYVFPKYDSESTYAWWIPFSVYTQNAVAVEYCWLPVDDGMPSQPYVVQQSSNVSGWVIANAESLTPLRIAYDEKNWMTMVQMLASGDLQSLSHVARAQLLSDSFALAWSDHIEYNIPITLANYLIHETEWVPFHAAFISLERIDNVLTGSIDYIVFERYVLKLVYKIYKPNMGYKNTNDLFYNKLQMAGIEWACRMKYPDCEYTAISYFDYWMKAANPDKNPIPRVLRGVVYPLAVARGSHEQWQFAVQRANASATTAASRRHLLRALMHTTDLPLLKTALQWTLNDDLQLQSEERVVMLCEAIHIPYSYPVVREFIYSKSEEILKRGGDDIKDLMSTLTKKFTTHQELSEFNLWSEKYRLDLDRFRLTIRQGVDYAKANINWMNSQQTRLIVLLKKHSPAPHMVSVLTRRNELKNFFSKDYMHGAKHSNTESHILNKNMLCLFIVILLSCTL